MEINKDFIENRAKDRNEVYGKFILNMVNFYIAFEKEFSSLIPKINVKGMTPLYARMLNEIHMEGCTTSNKLAQRLNLSVANTSRGVNALFRLGYIEKRTCTKDKRVSYITLSQNGFDLIQEALHRYQEKYFHKLDQLNTKEIETLTGYFKEITDVFLRFNSK